MKPNRLALARLGFPLLILAALVPAAAGLAQDRTTTGPLDAAREMFSSRMTASQAAGELQRTHRQTPRQVAGLLGPAGYATSDVTHALVDLRAPAADVVRWMMEERQPAGATAVGLRRAGLADVTIATALRSGGVDAAGAVAALHRDLRVAEATVGKVALDGGYAVAETRTALQGAGVRSDPEYRELGGCVGWDDRVFCPGARVSATTWPQAMGEVDWSPRSPGETGATLTLQSTNIPTVEVRIGSQTLQLLEATSTRIRAVLPTGSTSGDLVLVRTADGVTGTVEAGYTVVEPPAPPPPPAWSSWSGTALQAALQEIRSWLAEAEILASHCAVNGPNVTGTKGVFSSGYEFAGSVRTALLDAGAPAAVAEGWQTALEDAWNGYADQATIGGLPWYPSLLLYAGDEAPPVANFPGPLAGLVSVGGIRLSPPALADRIAYEIGADAATTDAGYAIAAFANEIGARFLAYVAATQVVNVMGGGPVPAYAPPLVHHAPVVGGTCAGTEVLDGPEF